VKEMIIEENFELYNGIKIPKLGLGTWMISNDDVVDAVKTAIDLGYRHIDTAQAYRNEQGVGEGIRASGIDRDQIFLTTKLDAGIKSYDEAVKSINQSLDTLGFDYVDLMIIHSPQPWDKYHGENKYFEGNREAWKALEEAYEAGKLRAIGLSNFEQVDIDNILENCSIKPMVNQILVHISNTPKDLIAYTEENDMLVEAYSPIAHGELLKNDDVKKMAEKYEVSVPQLSIRYDLQLGFVTLPKTANPAHMKSNADVDFVISEEDMEFLKNVDQIEDYGEASMMPVYSGK